MNKQLIILIMLLLLVLISAIGGVTYKRVICQKSDTEFNEYVMDNYRYNMSREMYCVMLPWYMS